MIFSTSNINKAKEFKEFLPDLEIISDGPDIKEIDSSYSNVILYKSKDMGSGFLVEDTVLFVNGIEVVDIRWKIDSLQEGDIALWVTSLAYNDGKTITVYEGLQPGFITKVDSTPGFGYDPYFIPLGSELTLAQLGDKKRYFSARLKAIQSMLDKEVKMSVNIEDLLPWSGPYQNE